MSSRSNTTEPAATAPAETASGMLALGYRAAATRSILLWGPPGSGKSSIGRRLAETLGLGFVDLDDEIEKRTGTSVGELFASRGENGFRALERSALEELLRAPERGVIALGGGTLLDPVLRLHAEREALLFVLRVSTPELERRLQTDPRQRPLLQQRGLARLLHEREGAYRAAGHLRVSAEQSPERVVDRLTALLVGAAQVPLSTNEGAYAAWIGSSAAKTAVGQLGATELASWTGLVVDETLLEKQPDFLARWWDGSDEDVLVIPAGEKAKTVETLTQTLGWLLERGADRQSLVTAAGGGATSDLVGLAASLFMRKIRWISLPTTLLSMVDASLGGKTAINLNGIKNPIGAFHQPLAVIVDPGLCDTQSERDYRSGFAEIIKCALLSGEAFLAQIEANVAALLRRESSALEAVVVPALQFKAAVVQADPLEHGCRAWLNLGHTLGHALEAEGSLTHGEAVGLGLLASLHAGEQLGLTDPALRKRIASLLSSLGLPTEVTAQALEGAKSRLSADKKRRGRNLDLLIVSSAGAPQIVTVPIGDLTRLLRCP